MSSDPQPGYECIECGYSVKNDVHSGRCPECGGELREVSTDDDS